MSARLPLADIEFIADFAAYARSRGAVAYDYGDSGECALAQFLRDTGRADDPNVSACARWSDAAKCERHEAHSSPDGVHGALIQDEIADERFDLLADRLEALIVDAPVVERAR